MSKAPVIMPRLYKLAEGLSYGRIYWVSGDLPTNNRQRNEVTAPPSAGWSHCCLIDKGGQLVTLFCPYSLESFQVSRTSYEVTSMCMDSKWVPNPKNPANRIEDGYKSWDEEDTIKVIAIIQRNWDIFGKLNMSGKDFDTAAVVLQMLGVGAPLRITSENTEPEKPRGGKEADVLGLLRPVKPESVRGRILAFFLPRPRSIREAMAEFGYSRSNVLSHLYMLTKEHGIGYALSGDAATIILPPGCSDPFIT